MGQNFTDKIGCPLGLGIVKKLARRNNVAQGKILSELARKALTDHHLLEAEDVADCEIVGGFRPFSSRGIMVTNEHVNRLRDQEGI